MNCFHQEIRHQKSSKSKKSDPVQNTNYLFQKIKMTGKNLTLKVLAEEFEKLKEEVEELRPLKQKVVELEECLKKVKFDEGNDTGESSPRENRNQILDDNEKQESTSKSWKCKNCDTCKFTANHLK